MKRIKGLVVLLILFILLLVGCGENKDSVVFKLKENNVTLNIGQTYTPELIIDNIDDYELELKSNSELIKIIDDSIYCEMEGYCEVLISLKNNSKIKDLTLKITIVEIIPDSIECKEEVNVCIDQTYQLNVKFNPIESLTDLIYSSNNDEVVRVDENGLITGLSEGQTHVVIKTKLYPNIRIRVLVNVTKAKVESIESIDSLNLKYNETKQLTWNVIPSGAEQKVIFESSDPSVCDVDENGLLSAYKYGSAIIKIISSVDEKIFKEINVSVDGDKASEIVIDEDVINLELGDEYELKYSVYPHSAYQGKDILCENLDAIEINDNTIIAKKTGTYELSLNTIDETNLSKNIIINVSGPEEPIFVFNSEFEEQSIISWNEEFNLLANIKAYDNKDGDITDKIKVNGEVDNRRYGEYNIEYYIEDSEGNKQILTRCVNVIWDYDVTVIGHAGSYYGVPNSEEAILYAAEVLKYPAIEIDLKQTKDGVFVLSHDPVWGSATLESTNYRDLKDVLHTVTKNAGVVGSNLSESERTYSAKICTFERYLQICREYNIIAVVELKTSSGVSNWTEKNAPTQSRMKDIIALIEKHDMLNNVVFLSNQELCLNWVKTNGYEYIPCQYLSMSSCENEDTYNLVKQYKLDISFNVRDGIKISDEWLEKYRELGCKLAVFTFEEYATYKDIQTWIDRGVDFVTTDWHVLDELNLPKAKR